MTPERERQLTTDMTTNLTNEEHAEGWHFCPEWDFDLIHKSHPEFEACICEDQRANKEKEQ